MTTTTKRRRIVFPDGDSAARTPAELRLEDAFVRFEPELLGTLRHLLGNADDARDALQDGFVRCWKNRDNLDEIVNLRAWVFRVAYNVGLDVLKSGWRRRRKAVSVEELEPTTDGGADPEARALESERLAALRDAIRRLEGKEKDVFLLRQNGELTYEQIAQATGLPLGTVKTTMRRALAKLRAAAEAGVRPDVAENAENDEVGEINGNSEKIENDGGENAEGPTSGGESTENDAAEAKR